MSAPRVVIVGHVEWVTHTRGVVPARGHIADLTDAFAEPAGGGGVAAVAAARLGAHTTLLTALGDDAAARTSADVLASRGVHVVAAHRDAPQTPVLTITEQDGERTIMVVGDRLQASRDDRIHEPALHGARAAYYTGEDPSLLRAIRDAVPVLVVSGRRLVDVIEAQVTADVVVGSINDPDEDPAILPPQLRAAWVVRTDGPRGGLIDSSDGATLGYQAAAPPAAPIDSYGCGDSFAAGLTVGLARGLDLPQAVELGAIAGAKCVTWRGGIGPG